MKYEKLDVQIPLFPTVSGIIVVPVGLLPAPIIFQAEGGFIKIPNIKKALKIKITRTKQDK